MRYAEPKGRRVVPQSRSRGGAIWRLLLVSISLCSTKTAWSQTDRLRGLVTATDSLSSPIQNARVLIIRAGDRAEYRTSSSPRGYFDTQVADGSGDYLLIVSADGFASARRRVTGAVGSTFTADFRLAPSTATLATVKVTEQASRTPLSANEVRSTVGTQTFQSAGIAGAVSPTDESSMRALAATIPGLSPDGSLLGAQGGLLSLNGLAVSGLRLPRGLRDVTVRSANSEYDPASGGYAGGQIRVEIGAGASDWTAQDLALMVRPSTLAVSDRAASSLGATPSVTQLGYTRNGELLPQRLWMNGGIQATRQTAPDPTVFQSGSAVLGVAGLSADSVRGLALTLSALGIPSNRTSTPGNRVQDEVVAIVRMDSRLYPATTQRSLTMQIGATRDRNAGSAITGASTIGGERRTLSGSVQGQLSGHLDAGKQWIAVTRAGLSFEQIAQRSALVGPSIVVGLRTSNPGGGVTRENVSIGGTPSMEQRTLRAEFAHEQSRVWGQAATLHSTKLGAWSRVDLESANSNPERFGTWVFDSRADLASGSPSSFTRVENVPTGRASVWNGALSLGDQWRPARGVTLLYGVRVDAWRALSQPAASNAVRALPGVPALSSPGGVSFSPRVAFRMRITGDENRDGRGGISLSPTGNRFVVPIGLLSGGIGAFRGTLPTNPFTQASAETGDASVNQRIVCYGADAAVPDWTIAFANSGARSSGCVQTPTAAMSDAGANVSLISPGFTPPLSWRGSLHYAMPARWGVLRIDLLGNLGFNQTSLVDVNAAGKVISTLAGEGLRPLYLDAGGIDSRTGAINAAPSRVSVLYGRVLEWRSDLRARGAQATVSFTPALTSESPHTIELSYTLARALQQYRGFAGGGFGAPTVPEWAASPFDVRHRLQVSLGTTVQLPRQASLVLTSFVRIESGVPFTPVVAGDVSGNGIAFDRAYLPRSEENSALAGALSALAARAPGYVASCLRRGEGRVPERGSCRGPWSADATFQMRFILPGSEVWGESPWRIALHIVNPMAGLDRLVHGPNALRGWGQSVSPDPVLLIPRGFDRAADRFIYDLNAQFGRPRFGAAALRAPMFVTLDISRAIGERFRTQQLARLVRPSRISGQRPSADSIAQVFTGLLGVGNPWAILLDQQEWLLLSKKQISVAIDADARLRVSLDSLFQPLARAVVAGVYAGNDRAASRAVVAAKQFAYEVFWAAGTAAWDLLSAVQRTALDPESQAILTSGSKRLQVYGL